MSVTRIRSIPTAYRGVKFRSRLESQWAQMFDAHGVVWAYEGEGYDLGGVAYLPDFYLPEIRTFVEVKGFLDAASVDKILRLADAVGAGRDPEEHPNYDQREMSRPLVVVAESPVGRAYSIEGGMRWEPETVWFAHCRHCNGWWFMMGVGYWGCRRCGAYEESRAHIAEMA